MQNDAKITKATCSIKTFIWNILNIFLTYQNTFSKTFIMKTLSSFYEITRKNLFNGEQE